MSTGYASNLQAVHYSAEASFCEVSSTFDTALSLVSEVDLSGLARDLARVPILQQRPNEGVQHILMPFDGKRITLRGRLTGLGATAAGAVPSSALATFLGMLIGNVANGLATGTTFTGGTAVAATTTAATGGVAGSLLRGGAVGDGRWGGQFHLVDSHAASTLTLLMAAAAAPNNGDVLYAGKMVYPYALTPSQFELPTTFRLRVLTSNGHYDMRGCFPLSAPRLTGLNVGETPEWEVEVGVSHVDTTSQTFPSATAPERHASSPVVNNSFAIQQVGTTTHNREQIRSIAVELGWTGVGLKGPASNYEGQCYNGARRVPGIATVEVIVDKEATGTDTWWDRAEVDPNTRPYWQAVFTASAQDGRAVGMAWPRLALMESQPIQMSHEGFNRQRLKFEAQLGDITTTDLTASPYRLAMA